MFAADFTANHPDMISEIIGICARLPLEENSHYAGMSLARRVGVKAMYFQTQKGSPADMALDNDEPLKAVLIWNCERLVGKETDGVQVSAMEMLACEGPWAHIMIAIQNTKTWFMNGAEGPAMEIATIAEYREAYPWIDIEVVPNTGQLLLFQHYEILLPRVAAAAKAVRNSPK